MTKESGAREDLLMKAETFAPTATTPQGPSIGAASFERVLAPTDFSPPSLKALHYARALSTGTVQLVHVIEPVYIAAPELALVPTDEERMSASGKELQGIAKIHDSDGPRVTSTVRLGRPANEIARVAREWPADLLVVSTHGRTGLSHLLLGSVTEKLIRSAPCPVLVIRKHEHDFARAVPGLGPKVSLARILVPTDFSAASMEALQYAIDLARRFGARISLVHTVQVAGADEAGEIPGVDTTELFRAARARATAEMERFLSDLPAGAVDRHLVVEGPPLSVLPAMAVAGKFDLLVCATNSESVLRHTILGSTAEGLVRHTYCPVLVVPSRVHHPE